MIGWLRDCGPLGWALLGGTIIVLIALRTRLASWALLLGLFLVAVGAYGAAWDGEPHLTQKFDATFFAWAKAVLIRAIAGCITLVLAAPLGQTGGKLAGFSRGYVGGLSTLGSLGLGLLFSSLYLQVQVAAALSVDRPSVRLELIRHAVTVSGYVLCGSAAVMALASLVLAGMLLDKRR